MWQTAVVDKFHTFYASLKNVINWDLTSVIIKLAIEANNVTIFAILHDDEESLRGIDLGIYL